MKDIFSDLYDRVLSFFITQNQDDTKLVAKSRLRTVLMQDRVGFSERAMQMLKDDLIETISRYLEIDVDNFELSIDADEEKTALNASIPVLRPKTDDEIDEAISIAQKEKIEKTQEIVGELQELVKEKAQELAGKMSDDDSIIEETVQTTEQESNEQVETEIEEETEDSDDLDDSDDSEESENKEEKEPDKEIKKEKPQTKKEKKQSKKNK